MRLSARKRFLALFILFVLLAVLLPAEEADDTVETEEKRSFLMFGPEDKPKQFIPMPIFIQNPTLGTGLGLSPMLMFKTDYDDEDSPYSVVAIPFFLYQYPKLFHRRFHFPSFHARQAQAQWRSRLRQGE